MLNPPRAKGPATPPVRAIGVHVTPRSVDHEIIGVACAGAQTPNTKAVTEAAARPRIELNLIKLSHSFPAVSKSKCRAKIKDTVETAA
jgi:hypothetical protein